MNKEGYIDAEQYAGQEQNSFKDIVMRQVNKIRELMTKEQRGGYFDRAIKVSSDGEESLIENSWVTDTREETDNAVCCLADITFQHFDKEMIDAEIKYKKETKDLYDKLSKKFEKKMVNANMTQKRFLEEQFTHKYRDEKRPYVRQLFRDLCSFLKRQNYFDSYSSED